MQQMQLEVNMQARAVLGGHCMTIGRVWVGLLRLIHLHVHSAITPHIHSMANAGPEHPTSERASVFEPRPCVILFAFRKEGDMGIIFHSLI